ncbi:MAG: T9SS type A sorting domain-containing protein [candidate division KSB1 bacterium]|nr:T9SS type A sorting domain-containing protein [candidate division KSB1 bacterium]
MRWCKVVWMVAAPLLAFAMAGQAQVLADFETNLGGFYDNGWGTGFASVTRASDPSGLSAGAMALLFDGTRGDKGDVEVDNVDASGAQIVTFFVYLPPDIPDSIQFKLFAQDNKNWAWTEVSWFAYQIPKGVWYPLDYDMEAMRVNPAVNFDHKANKLGRLGMEVNRFYEHDADAGWSGTIYVDNVSLLGAEPRVIGSFETGTDGFYDNRWGTGFTSLARVPDPTGLSAGSLGVTFSGAAGDKGDFEVDNVDASEYQVVTFFVYLPSDIPDSIQFKLFAQDNQHWAWTEVSWFAYQIPKGVWYPLDYDMEAMRLKSGGSFDHKANKLGRLGMEINRFFEHDADANWSGTIYIDNVSLLSSRKGARWVAASFERQSGGSQGFANTGWGPALLSVGWAQDPTGRSLGVMNTTWDFTKGEKGAFSNDNVSIYSQQAGTYASKVTIDVYIPEGMPHGAQVSIFAMDHQSWTWTEDKYYITDSTLTPGHWHTLTYDVLKYVNSGELNPNVTLSMGCQIYYSSPPNWQGNVYWDNFTLWGIPEPVGELASPPVQVSVDTVGAVVPYVVATIRWVDNTLGTETYNVYMSHSPITDLSAPGVVRIADRIPHGTEQWRHRPWSRQPQMETFYYAVTAVGPDGTETGITQQNVVGPVTLRTSPTVKAVYVPNFRDVFVLDGLDNEFEPYRQYTIVPETAGGPESGAWTPQSTDMNFRAIFVVDDDYLYISADVTDDDLRRTPGQAWEGDALEFYLGFYDARLVSAYHGYRSVGTAGTGDWRISFTAWGTTQVNGTTETTIPGVECTVYEKFTGDGYIIEARIAVDSLVGPEGLQIVDGAMIPLRIDGTDMDPSFGDTQRTLIVQFGGSGGNVEDWLRPGAWGFLEVYSPTGVADARPAAPTPKEFCLYDNYPNPFNPSTTLRYDLPTKAKVLLQIYDLAGRLVKTLVNEEKVAGSYQVSWDGTDEAGRTVASGVYFARMQAAEYQRTAKMLLLK